MATSFLCLSLFQTSLSRCVPTLGPLAVQARWRTATWRLFAVRHSKKCDLTASNSSTWSPGTARPTKVRDRDGIRQEREVLSVLFRRIEKTILICFVDMTKDWSIILFNDLKTKISRTSSAGVNLAFERFCQVPVAPCHSHLCVSIKK